MPDLSPELMDVANGRMLTGRCANGAERGRGKLVHAAPESWGKAVCGAQPGRLSAGWTHQTYPVTCPKCLKRIGAHERARKGE